MGAVWDPTIVEHTLPPSLYLAEKPVWLEDASFPVYGPESGVMDTKLPAESRYP